ncbi:hypothetical protein [Aminobacter sp. J44]|uniref:hypothetical protein n=1 Tax=Aminobacter sp. J44 TaxID=935262 RepID=UPI00119C04A2|nr:hypothetical protein [Aminobacter sp. J44]TWG60750.1 hypothetical protein L610_002600000070 [Aminobacter sp. J44]
MPLIVLILVLGLWFAFGSALVTIANWFWGEDAAPWEWVVLHYYPNRHDLIVGERIEGFVSVEECPRAALTLAASNNDPGLRRGDYECGVQELEKLGDVSVYRLPVR